MPRSNMQRITVRVTIGGDHAEVSGIADTKRHWENLTEAQLKEKANSLYRDALKSVVTANVKEVTPR